jgi:hypothetical protein
MSMVNKLIHQIGHRGTYLLFLALIDFSFAFVFAKTPQPNTHLFLPLHTWASIWAVTAIAVTVGAFMKKGDRWMFAAGATAKFLFTADLTYAWIKLNTPYGWINTLIWTAFTLLTVSVATWPEKQKPIVKELDLRHIDRIINEKD